MMTLSEFLERSHKLGNEGVRTVEPRVDVTALMYFYWDVSVASEKWPAFEGALLETWRNCGLIKTVVVTNGVHRSVEAFAGRYANVEIQIEKTLVPGSLKAMSLDCDCRLYRRFSTDYVLIVQNDGFPLRPTLDEFVGRFDYIGAPWVAHTTYFDLYPYPKYCVGNGGFSLRSRRICRAASECFQRYFAKVPYWWFLLGDDVFYCKTMRFLLPSVGRRFTWASPEEASRFSVENNLDFLPKGCLPLGFHSPEGFSRVMNLAI